MITQSELQLYYLSCCNISDLQFSGLGWRNTELGLGCWCLTPLSTIFHQIGINWSTRRKPQTCRKSLTMLYRVHIVWAGFEIITLMVICTDCIGSYKSNYHTITTTTAPADWRNRHVSQTNYPATGNMQRTTTTLLSPWKRIYNSPPLYIKQSTLNQSVFQVFCQ
jgi:hypothetical protein